LRGARILVAVSGGGDSIALLHVLARLAAKLAFQIVAHGVDHGLRKEARAELDIAERLAHSLGVEFERTELQLSAGSNLQARARDVRYAALREAQKRVRADLIATAHHADDRAETVLLRLMRGAGPRGLSVLPARSTERILPFVRARKTDIALHLERHRLTFANDPSNVDRKFLRARVRAELVPLLEDLSPQIVSHLNALADALQDKDDSSTPLSAADGPPLVLKRAHLTELRRARDLGQRKARILLPGGQELRLDPVTGRALITAAPKR
jgi:tRNA(Ile)-lysidine synthase